ncbi:MAG: RIP metalloprotease, partial [Armatimonadota bacterium]
RFLTGLIAIVVLFGACVFFHELGHFTLAKLIGMGVQEFAIGFGRRLWGVKRGQTEYAVNLVPLGGYVRIAGMEPGAEPEPGGFHTFPRWLGMTVLLAGSFMNVVLAALAFIVIGIAVGVPAFPGHTVNIRKVLPDSPAQAAGIRAGDRIVAIDGMTDSLLIEHVRAGGRAERAGLGRYDQISRVEGQDVGIPLQLVEALIAARAQGKSEVTAHILRYSEDGSSVHAQQVTLPIPDDLPNEARPGEAGRYLERALGVTFVPLGHDSALTYISDRAGQKIVLTIMREGRTLQIPVVPQAKWEQVPVQDEQGRLDLAHKSVGRIGVVLAGETRPVGVARAIRYGVQASIDAVRMVIGGFIMMFSGQIAPQASGPVGIAAETLDRARIGWSSVVSFVGIISANLAVINLLPIPPFDGFRVVLLTIEALIRRRVNERIEIGVTVAGVALILGFFLVITFQDVLNLVLFRNP